eukprot:8806000-Lingulodinium_polyedra.AAC.1
MAQEPENNLACASGNAVADRVSRLPSGTQQIPLAGGGPHAAPYMPAAVPAATPTWHRAAEKNGGKQINLPTRNTTS